MKKLLSIIYIVLACVLCSLAQDATAIMTDFINKTGLRNHRNETLRMEMSMDYQGVSVPLIITFSEKRSSMRMEMTIQEAEVAMVIVGNEGWIESGNQVQPLPDEFVSSTKSLTFVASVSELLSNCKFSLSGENQTEFEINVKPGENIGEMKVSVDKASGLLNKVVMTGSSPATLTFSNYRNFSDVKFPSNISAESNSQLPTNFSILDIAFGVKIPDWYFSKK